MHSHSLFRKLPSTYAFSLAARESLPNLCILSNSQVFQLTTDLSKSYPWIHHHDKIFGLSGQNSCIVKLTNSLLQQTLQHNLSVQRSIGFALCTLFGYQLCSGHVRIMASQELSVLTRWSIGATLRLGTSIQLLCQCRLYRPPQKADLKLFFSLSQIAEALLQLAPNQTAKPR